MNGEGGGEGEEKTEREAGKEDIRRGSSAFLMYVLILVVGWSGTNQLIFNEVVLRNFASDTISV